MRFVPSGCLRRGMICAKKILGKNGELLLNKGAVIHQTYIYRIRELGFAGIYIEDDYSEGIEFVDIISETQRANSVRAVKDLFSCINNNQGNIKAKMQMLHKTVEDIVKTVIDNKDTNVNLLDLKIFDDYTYYHCVNVGVLSILMATRMKMAPSRIHHLGMAAMLHDIGKVFINKNILNKAGLLSDYEFEEMKSHSSRGFEYLRMGYNSFSSECLRAVLEHHERVDGKGYPEGKKSKDISQFAKIISLVDVFDALTSDRPYRPAVPPSDAIEYIMAESNKAFDPVLTHVFLSCIMPYSPGSTVQLSNGWVGIVVKNYYEASLRPIVRIIRHQTKELPEDAAFVPYDLDLFKDRDKFDITVIGNLDR